MAVPAPENAVHPLTRGEWREWLTRNYARREGVWLISYKRHTDQPRVDYDEAVEEALCFGWIDSKTRALDADRSMLWFAPRKPRTGWSRSNHLRVERLIAAKLMEPPGLAKIEAARADGSWTALDGAEALEVPPDLGGEFGKYPTAAANFDAFPRSAKRAILAWISLARTSETRAKRVAETARLAEQNLRAKQ